MNYKGYIACRAAENIISNTPGQAKIAFAKGFILGLIGWSILIISIFYIHYELNKPAPKNHPVGYVEPEMVEKFQKNIDRMGYTMIYGKLSNGERVYLEERGISCGEKMYHSTAKDKYVCK